MRAETELGERDSYRHVRGEGTRVPGLAQNARDLRPVDRSTIAPIVALRLCAMLAAWLSCEQSIRKEMSDEAFLTTEEVLDYLRIDLRTVYRLIKAGELPALRVGRQWRFRKSDLDGWLERRRSALVGPTASSTPSVGSAHVLIVEDDKGVREILSKGLSLAEYEVDAVSDGQGALQRLRAGSYDLLIVDLSLPDIDGLAVVREASQLDPSARVIILTGHSSERAAIEAANLGVKAYLTKPVRIHQVLMKVAKALED